MNVSMDYEDHSMKTSLKKNSAVYILTDRPFCFNNFHHDISRALATALPLCSTNDTKRQTSSAQQTNLNLTFVSILLTNSLPASQKKYIPYKHRSLCKIWGFHGGDCEEWCFLAAWAGSSLADFSTLKMEAILSSEMSVYTRSTRRHIPEDGILRQSLNCSQ
jgi:hypothetical protein